ncbi:MAG: hypothetical protein H8D45_10055 [Bacteroidetes bacterium]|nr:hypothetical protein [Bacteroidota bacterium]
MNLTASSLFSLMGKKVLLTGASGFLSRIFGRVLLENGANLIALGKSEKIKNQVVEWKSESHLIDKYKHKGMHSWKPRIS